MSPEPTATPAVLSSRPNLVRRLTILSCPVLTCSVLTRSATGGYVGEILADELEVITFLHNRAERVAGHIRVQIGLTQEVQGLRPVDGLRNARRFGQV